MISRDLREDEIDAGYALVEAANSLNVELSAAFWYYDHNEYRWRLMLEASPVCALTPLEFSKRLHQAAASVGDKTVRNSVIDLLLGPIMIATQSQPITRFLQGHIGKSSAVGKRLANILGESTLVEGAFIYRLGNL